MTSPVRVVPADAIQPVYKQKTTFGRTMGSCMDHLRVHPRATSHKWALEAVTSSYGIYRLRDLHCTSCYKLILEVDVEHSGDIGYGDDDDEVFIVDRVKELIKTKCFQSLIVVAFNLSAEENGDIAVIEDGLGGAGDERDLQTALMESRNLHDLFQQSGSVETRGIRIVECG